MLLVLWRGQLGRWNAVEDERVDPLGRRSAVEPWTVPTVGVGMH